ncbi:TRAP transporter permease [Devosia marina]|uniref:TRAP transporter fused permease subunit n=1 Tax=Devosia marina TaxID=2683198 RepID=A0A7X3FSP9_9HYPH|nr:TRAP transporter permease [Devosia marina]MVS99928.1 TRAP transporter fused permease subunit [Devosia marina]
MSQKNKSELSAVAETELRLDEAAANVDEETLVSNQREFLGAKHWLIATACVLYSVFHLLVMNVYPLETWVYRLSHVGGGLVLGFLIFSAVDIKSDGATSRSPLSRLVLAGAAVGVLFGFAMFGVILFSSLAANAPSGPDWAMDLFGLPLFLGTVLAMLHSWKFPDERKHNVALSDVLLVLATIAAIGYIIIFARPLQLRAGMPMALPSDMWAAVVGVLLVIELTRRLAGMALVIIAGVFVLYSFVGPWLPGIFYHRGYEVKRFFTYIFTDNGILSAPISISSTYIILFVIFAAFLQVTKVGEYFVNFAFAAAGHKRGGPAKVSVFASGLMGMINGTSAGNVVATGSLTIPMMRKVGYRPQTAAAVEAAASTGGQIMPPIMGAGAFIMAEITGIPYVEIVYAAIIPAIIYFLSVYFMVDLAAQKHGMTGLPRSALPKFGKLLRQIYLFTPIVVLIGSLLAGYSVIRCGTLAMASAAVVSWLTPHKMGPLQLFRALEMGARMTLQLVAVCATAGIIVGVIALTGIGSRFSSVLLGLAEHSQLLALGFAMIVSIVLGMGMPTTAAYVVAASVMAPGLINLGIEPLTAHFFIFYFAVMSAITPPVALAAYAGAALSGSDPVKTSVESFKLGLAAFIVPFMFYLSDSMLLQGTWIDAIHVTATASVGVYLLSSSVQGWFFGHANNWVRLGLLAAGITMIEAGWLTDAIGVAAGVVLYLVQKKSASRETATAQQ